QRRALVAALLLLDLDDDFLPFGEQFAHAAAALRLAVTEEFPGDFLQRQEAMAFTAIVDEGRFERGLDARDARLIDVGFFLFPRRDVDGEIVEFLAIDQGNAQFFLLRCVDEHSFHEFHSEAWEWQPARPRAQKRARDRAGEGRRSRRAGPGGWPQNAGLSRAKSSSE